MARPRSFSPPATVDAASDTSSPALPLSPSLPPKKEKFYRIRRISNYLAELLEVEVDETQVKATIIGKQDLPEILQEKAMQHVYPSADARWLAEVARNKKNKG